MCQIFPHLGTYKNMFPTTPSPKIENKRRGRPKILIRLTSRKGQLHFPALSLIESAGSVIRAALKRLSLYKCSWPRRTCSRLPGPYERSAMFCFVQIPSFLCQLGLTRLLGDALKEERVHWFSRSRAPRRDAAGCCWRRRPPGSRPNWCWRRRR